MEEYLRKHLQVRMEALKNAEPGYVRGFMNGWHEREKSLFEELQKFGVIWGPGRPMEEAKDKGWILCALVADPLPIVLYWRSAKREWLDRRGWCHEPVCWWPLPEPQKEGE